MKKSCGMCRHYHYRFFSSDCRKDYPSLPKGLGFCAKKEKYVRGNFHACKEFEKRKKMENADAIIPSDVPAKIVRDEAMKDVD